MFNLVFFERLFARGFNASISQEIGDVRKPLVATSVSLKGLFDERGTPFIYDNAFTTQVVDVAKRCVAGIFALPYFLA